MRKLFTALALCIFPGTALIAQTPAPIVSPTSQSNGTIVENTACVANTIGSHDEYAANEKKRHETEAAAAKSAGFTEAEPDFAARIVNKEDFERQKAYAGFECRKIKYMSDGLKVVGFIWKPTNIAARKLPLIIVNHGGNREFAKLTPWQQFGYYNYVSNGFVVIGSQYRGIDGGEGKEEFGGADVNDVLNVMPLAHSLGYVDMNNIFMLGFSRGGMMTFLALKKGVPVNAAATVGGPTDFKIDFKRRPGMVNVFKDLIPDFETKTEERMRERSAVDWADKINAPLLILQGGSDWRTDPADSLSLAQKLQALGKPYELVVYAGDNHPIANDRVDRDRRIVEWFKKHIK